MKLLQPLSRPRFPIFGLTVLELLVAMAISSIVLTAVAALAVYTAKSFVAIGNYDDLDRKSRAALDVLSQDVRQAQALSAYQTNQITLLDANGGTLIYRWSPSTGMVTRQTATSSKVMLTGCDHLEFHIFQRNPRENFEFYSATNPVTGLVDPSMCKVINVSWKCSRQIFGQKANTESVQTAMIVMRN